MMQREIKFRGKRIDNGDWIYGYYFSFEYSDGTVRHSIVPGKFSSKPSSYFYVDPKTVAQYTGLKDKNGREIYDGDLFTVNGKFPKIIKYIENIVSYCAANIDEVKCEKYFDVWQRLNKRWWDEFHVEIIGNIHDNTEMLETNT